VCKIQREIEMRVKLLKKFGGVNGKLMFEEFEEFRV